MESHARSLALKTPVAEMELSVRVVNTLEEYGVILAENLVSQSYESITGMKNLGDKTLKEIQVAVAALGLPAPQWRRPTKQKTKGS